MKEENPHQKMKKNGRNLLSTGNITFYISLRRQNPAPGGQNKREGLPSSQAQLVDGGCPGVCEESTAAGLKEVGFGHRSLDNENKSSGKGLLGFVIPFRVRKK
jgi:hypothetical protein